MTHCTESKCSYCGITAAAQGGLCPRCGAPKVPEIKRLPLNGGYVDSRLLGDAASTSSSPVIEPAFFWLSRRDRILGD
jgi:predicted amidophosphoribosyltransferase